MMLESGNAKGAQQVATPAVQNAPNDPDAQSAAAMYEAESGNQARARRIIQSLEQSKALIDPVKLAMLHHEIEEDDVAVDCLERAYRERSPELAFIGMMPHMPVCSACSRSCCTPCTWSNRKIWPELPAPEVDAMNMWEPDVHFY